MRTLVLISMLLCAPLCLMAQESKPQSTPKNQTDAKGQRQGVWWLQQPAMMGERAYAEWGSYSDNRKNGLWYRMNGADELLSVEHYRNDVLDGEVKYFDNGRLTVIGHYYGVNPSRPLDTIIVMEPVTHEEMLVPVRTDRGSLRHGLWRYYDAFSGRLIREEDYQADVLLYRKDFPVSNTDSIYYQQRNANLPHMKKGHYYKPPASKRSQF